MEKFLMFMLSDFPFWRVSGILLVLSYGIYITLYRASKTHKEYFSKNRVARTLPNEENRSDKYVSRSAWQRWKFRLKEVFKFIMMPWW